MIYSVPVNAASEVRALAAAGAGELYCGLQEPWWVERYGDHDSASRRQGRANLGSREELAQTARAAQAHGVSLYLALNGMYDEYQLDYLMELARWFEHIGGTGVIARDAGLLLRLKQDDNGLKRVLSLLAVCANAPSVDAYARLGVSRVVFPRFLDAAHIHDILGGCAAGGVEAESMVFFDKCPLVDGYCRHYHGVAYPERSGADAVLAGEPLYTFDTGYRTHACLGKSCSYLEPYPCAACELQRMEDAGVSFAKIGGRGRALEERVRALVFLREAQRLPSDQWRQELYQRTFARSCACYYGTSTQSATSIEPIRVAKEPRRTYVGDVRDPSRLRSSVCALLRDGSPSAGTPAPTGALTVLIGPMPQEELERGRWESTVRMLCDALRASGATDVHLCANDVGTLASLIEVRDQIAASLAGGRSLRLSITAGPLLVQRDRPQEWARFLDPEQNPPRAVYDLEGRPRMLVYRSPCDSLVSTPEGYANVTPPTLLWDHWSRRMRYDARTSYREALAAITGDMVDAEFDDQA